MWRTCLHRFLYPISSPKGTITSTMTINDIDLSGKLHDLHLVSAQADKYSARLRHNAQQPLLTLSPELLGIILLYLRYVDPFPWRHKSLGWMNATHVCRRLRAVALGYADLWSVIDITSSSLRGGLLEEFLRRSQGVPITLNIPRAINAKRAALTSALLLEPRHRSRYGDVHIENAFTLPSFVERLLNNPAPALEAIDIEVSRPPGVMITLPSACFAKDAPRLQKFVSKGYQFLWSSMAFPSLVHLDLLCQAGGVDGPTSRIDMMGREVFGAGDPSKQDVLEQTIQQTLDCLRKLPRLEKLLLRNALPTLRHSDPIARVSLHRLTHLKLTHMEFVCCSWLLEGLRAPKLKSLIIGSYASARFSDEVHERAYITIASFLSSFVQHSISPIHVLRVKLDRVYLKIDAWTRADMASYWRWNSYRIYPDESPSQSLSISLSFSPFNRHGMGDSASIFARRHRIVHGLLNSFPSSQLETLILWDELPALTPDEETLTSADTTTPQKSPVDYALWRSLLDQWSNVKHLQLMGSAMLTILPLLGRGPTQSQFTNQEGPEDVVFPRLAHLTVSPWSRSLVAGIEHWFTLPVHAQCGRSERFLAVIQACLASRVPIAPKLDYLKVTVPISPRGTVWRGQGDMEAAKVLQESLAREVAMNVEVSAMDS